LASCEISAICHFQGKWEKFVTAESVVSKGARKARTLEEEIAAQREKLRKLEDKHREQQKKERERNQKAVVELLKSEKLDLVSVDRWKELIPVIKKALHDQGVEVETTAGGEPT
jgi:flagellar motility protein MotE (MotC chaperone)